MFNGDFHLLPSATEILYRLLILIYGYRQETGLYSIKLSSGLPYTADSELGLSRPIIEAPNTTNKTIIALQVSPMKDYFSPS